MPATVKKLCHSLVKGNWLSGDASEHLQQQWRKRAPDGDLDLEAFLQFLVQGGHLTEAQHAKVRQSLHKIQSASDEEDGAKPAEPKAAEPKRATSPPPAPKAAEPELDVELVAVPRAKLRVPGQGLELDRRDWLMLSIGGGGSLLAVILASSLAAALKPKPIPLDPEEPKEIKEPKLQKEPKESKEPKETKEPKESKEPMGVSNPPTPK